jgi:hypothetical protein
MLLWCLICVCVCVFVMHEFPTNKPAQIWSSPLVLSPQEQPQGDSKQLLKYYEYYHEPNERYPNLAWWHASVLVFPTAVLTAEVIYSQIYMNCINDV